MHSARKLTVSGGIVKEEVASLADIDTYLEYLYEDGEQKLKGESRHKRGGMSASTLNDSKPAHGVNFEMASPHRYAYLMPAQARDCCCSWHRMPTTLRRWRVTTPSWERCHECSGKTAPTSPSLPTSSRYFSTYQGSKFSLHLSVASMKWA